MDFFFIEISIEIEFFFKAGELAFQIWELKNRLNLDKTCEVLGKLLIKIAMKLTN